MPVRRSCVPRMEEPYTEKAVNKQLLSKSTQEVTTSSESCSLSAGKGAVWSTCVRNTPRAPVTG